MTDCKKDFYPGRSPDPLRARSVSPFGMPEADGPVVAAGRQQPVVRRKRQRIDFVGMTIQRAQFRTGDRIPKQDPVIIASGGQSPSVPRETNRPDIADVSSRNAACSVGNVPETDIACLIARCQRATIRREINRPHLIAMRQRSPYLPASSVDKQGSTRITPDG